MPSPGCPSRANREIIQPQNNILRRNDNRLTVGGREDVVGRHHQNAGLKLRLDRERHVNSHLVAVEVGVKRGTDQRVELNRFALRSGSARTPESRGGAASGRGSA
jgi:hypothetical protein